MKFDVLSRHFFRISKSLSCYNIGCRKMPTRTLKRRFSFSLRTMLFVVALIATFFSFDQYVESTSRRFENLAKNSPEKLQVEPCSMPGKRNFKIKVYNKTTVLDRLFLRRRFIVHYYRLIQYGSTHHHTWRSPTYHTSLAGHRLVDEN